VGSPVRQGHGGVNPFDIGPARGHGSNLFLARHPEEDPVLPPRVRIPDQLELPAGQRVERVGDREASRTAGTTCI